MSKLVPIFLVGSLTLNAVLTVALVAGARRNLPVTATPAPAAARATNATPTLDAKVWSELVGGDLKTVVARLRESGFPPEIVRAIVSERLTDQFSARRKAIDPDAESRPFWKSPIPDAEKMVALRQLSRDQQNALRELLGPEADLYDPMSIARDKRLFGHLSSEKAAEARRLVREFNELRSDVLRGGYGGPIMITNADREKMNAIDKQLKGELMKIMTPEEFEAYELRGSNTANSLRYQLGAFDASETEFLAIYRLQRDFDDRFGQFTGQPSQEEIRIRSEAQRQLTDQIKAALGPARAEQYTRATDYEYRTTSQLVTRLELPAETTDKAWAVKDDIQKRAMLARQDQSLTPEQRTEKFAALQQEAIERITPLFGARGIEAYRQYGGQWIEAMAPRPRSDSAVRR